MTHFSQHLDPTEGGVAVALENGLGDVARLPAKAVWQRGTVPLGVFFVAVGLGETE